jgi:hypothetical protein
MKQIDTDYVHINFLDDKTVLVEVREGVEIDYDKASNVIRLINDKMKSDYGIISNRKADYSIVPHQVYDVLNSIENLKAIAIVVTKRTFLPLTSEQKFFNKKLEAFETIQEAHKWILNALSV